MTKCVSEGTWVNLAKSPQDIFMCLHCEPSTRSHVCGNVFSPSVRCYGIPKYFCQTWWLVWPCPFLRQVFRNFFMGNNLVRETSIPGCSCFKVLGSSRWITADRGAPFRRTHLFSRVSCGLWREGSFRTTSHSGPERRPLNLQPSQRWQGSRPFSLSHMDLTRLSHQIRQSHTKYRRKKDP